jgi:hypothetical protein
VRGMSGGVHVRSLCVEQNKNTFPAILKPQMSSADPIILAGRHEAWNRCGDTSQGVQGRYSTLMPVARITSPSLVYSARTMAANTSGGLGRLGMTPEGCWDGRPGHNLAAWKDSRQGSGYARPHRGNDPSSSRLTPVVVGPPHGTTAKSLKDQVGTLEAPSGPFVALRPSAPHSSPCPFRHRPAERPPRIWSVSRRLLVIAKPTALLIG